MFLKNVEVLLCFFDGISGWVELLFVGGVFVKKFIFCGVDDDGFIFMLKFCFGGLLGDIKLLLKEDVEK